MHFDEAMQIVRESAVRGMDVLMVRGEDAYGWTPAGLSVVSGNPPGADGISADDWDVREGER